jgi:hypothetical protein
VQLLQVLGADGDRQDAVLEAVVVEDVCEGCGDDAADAEVEQRPGRMLAGRAAAEIVACDQDLRLAIGRLVQDEAGDLLAAAVITHLVEQCRAEAGPLDGLQELLRDDHVGIDVDQRQGCRDAGQNGEPLHCANLSFRPGNGTCFRLSGGGVK